MNNKNDQMYVHAGLFCGLDNATFENVDIDSSCSFSGNSFAGALSVSMTGSLTVTNVTNKADVSGSYGVGGLIGMIKNLNQGFEVAFKDCVNDGKITGWSYVGGLVGQIQSNGEINHDSF